MRMKFDRGYTVLEVLIIVAVVAVVGAITYPKFRTALYASREGGTKANLGDLRGALAIYYSDNHGLYPSDEGTPETRLKVAIVPKYLKAMPAVELPHHHAGQGRTVQNEINDGGDWTYSTLDGFVAVNCTHLDTKGAAISGW